MLDNITISITGSVGNQLCLLCKYTSEYVSPVCNKIIIIILTITGYQTLPAPHKLLSVIRLPISDIDFINNTNVHK
ncbi:hypothetical protein oki361_13630 [Helicobacter pylori]